MASSKSIQLLRDLVTLSRFNKYNPVFTTFAGGWSVLLSGAARVAAGDGISAGFVFSQTALCVLAAYLFCGAGMVWNDWIDRDIDANVERTKNRPLAAGRIDTGTAMAWMVLQAALSWEVLEILLQGRDVWKHFVPVMLASILYPFAKRPTARALHIYPQYLLAFTIAWPAIPGRAAIHGANETFNQTTRQCLPLCVMVFFWTIYLNTAYSYQDVVDDTKLGVNSLYAVVARGRTHLLLALLAGPVLVCLPFCLLASTAGVSAVGGGTTTVEGNGGCCSAWLWMSWVGVWAVVLAQQLVSFDSKKPASGGSLHRSNFMLGVWTMAACAVEVGLSAWRSSRLL